MPVDSFVFYRTFLPSLCGLDDPVVLSFDNTAFLNAYAEDETGMPQHFIHSGNFFSRPHSTKPELRTKERVLALQEQLINAKTAGFITLNVPVSCEIKTPIWEYARDIRVGALEQSLRAAMWARERTVRPDLLYAGFEVGTYSDALYIFDKASNANFTRLSAGFGLFSRFSKFRAEDRLQQFEVLAAYNRLLHEHGDMRFHASGGSALNVLELLAYSNVSSADGSSAVLAGLAYGSVLTTSGRLIRANKLEEWKCECGFCASKSQRDALTALKCSPEARVTHNIHVIRSAEARINEALKDNTIAELTEKRLNEYDKKELWKCYALVREQKPGM